MRAKPSALRALATSAAAAALVLGAPAPQAAARPAGFPDLRSFTPVSIDDYIEQPVKGPRYAYFSTPYNIQCYFEAGEPIAAWAAQDIHCAGDFPGLDKTASAGSCTTGVTGFGEGGMGPDYTLTDGTDPCGTQFTRGTLLNVGQKLSYGNATCVVGANTLIACLDTTRGEHGFVLQPSGNIAF